MYITFLLLLSLLTAQNYDYKSFKIGSFKGEIVDNSNNLPVKYATIKLFKASDSTLVDGTISEEDGFFIIRDIGPGKYNLQVEHVMYETLRLEEQMLVPPNINKNLGLLSLSQKIVEVEGVSVVDEKPFVQEEIDKKVYNVEDMSIAVSGTAEDVLSSLPSITVSTEGEVSLRGNQSVNIMIDGRMKSADNLDILDAAMIEKVEVIAIPSAKYDPDGTAGIINIITKRNEYTGTSGKTTVGFDSFGSKTFSINTNYFKDKLNLFTTYTNGDREREGYAKRDRTIIGNENNSLDGYKRYSNFDGDSKNQYLKFGLEFYPSENRTFYSDLNYSDYNKLKFDIMQTDPIPDGLTTITNTNTDRDGYERGLVAGYIMKLDDGREITIETNSQFEKESDLENIDDIFVSEKEESNKYMFKIDYTHPFPSEVLDKQNLLEVGILDKQNGHSNYFNYNNIAEYDFNNSRNILATYIDVSYYIKSNFSLKFGTRFENTIRNFKANSSEISSELGDNDFYLFLINKQLESDLYNKNYSTIYPSLFFNYDLGEQKGNIKFGFGRRVERPGDWYLSPLPRSFSEPNQVHIGNPVIDPEDIFKYEISYSNRLKIGYLSSSFFLTSITDVFDWDMDKYILTEDTFIQDENCVTDCYYALSHDNIAKKTEYGIEVFMMTRPLKWWDLKFGGDITFGKLSSESNSDESIESDQNGNTSSTSLFANSSFTIKDNLKLDMNTWMWMAKLTDGKIHPTSGTNLALKYDFKTKFSFIFKVNDLFDSQKFSIETSNQYILENITYIDNMDYERQRKGRSFTLSLDYRFGDYKENKFKKGSQYDGGGGDMMGY